MKYYMVLNPVGPHVPGQVIAISPEDEKNGVDVDRLIGLNAIQEATEEQADEAVQYGSGDPAIQGIPQVEPKPETVKSEGGTRAEKAATAKAAKDAEKAAAE